jgi:hypothetical protein
MNLHRIFKALYIAGAVCAGGLMVALFVAAFCEIGTSLLIFFHRIPVRDLTSTPESEAITVALKGIEYLFLAPMSFLVYRSLAIYVADMANGGHNPAARSAVTEAKSLVTSLMIAVVATDLVGKVLSPDGLAQRRPIYELILIVVLGGYYLMLHHIGKGER